MRQNPSPLVYALIYGHAEIVDCLMTHWYEPLFNDYETKKAVRKMGLTLSPLPNTDNDIGELKEYKVTVPSHKTGRLECFSSLAYINIVVPNTPAAEDGDSDYDNFPNNPNENGYNVPISFYDVYGTVCLIETSHNQALHALLYRPRYLRTQNCPMDASVTYAAAGKGNLSIVQWLRKLKPPCPWNANVFAAAPGTGNLELIKWMRKGKLRCPWDGTAFNTSYYYAAKNDPDYERINEHEGPWCVFRWLQARRHPSCPLDGIHQNILDECFSDDEYEGRSD